MVIAGARRRGGGTAGARRSDPGLLCSPAASGPRGVMGGPRAGGAGRCPFGARPLRGLAARASRRLAPKARRPAFGLSPGEPKARPAKEADEGPCRRGPLRFARGPPRPLRFARGPPRPLRFARGPPRPLRFARGPPTLLPPPLPASLTLAVVLAQPGAERPCSRPQKNRRVQALPAALTRGTKGTAHQGRPGPRIGPGRAGRGGLPKPA